MAVMAGVVVAWSPGAIMCTVIGMRRRRVQNNNRRVPRLAALACNAALT
jgi:hypothetical protein